MSSRNGTSSHRLTRSAVTVFGNYHSLSISFLLGLLAISLSVRTLVKSQLTDLKSIEGFLSPDPFCGQQKKKEESDEPGIKNGWMDGTCLRVFNLTLKNLFFWLGIHAPHSRGVGFQQVLTPPH